MIVNTVLIALSARLRENTPPSNASEETRRISFVNSAVQAIYSYYPFWFSEKMGTLNSVQGKTIYAISDGLPSDIREIRQLKVNGTLYTPINSTESEEYLNTETYYQYGDSLVLSKAPISSITDGMTIKYKKSHPLCSAKTDVIYVPETYIDAVVSYTGGLWWQQRDKGRAADYFAEYKSKMDEMMLEHSRREYSHGTSSEAFYGLV